MPETIKLVITDCVITTIKVDRARYEAAKAARELDHFLDPYVSNLTHDTTIIEPDGTEFDPYSDRYWES